MTEYDFKQSVYSVVHELIDIFWEQKKKTKDYTLTGTSEHCFVILNDEYTFQFEFVCIDAFNARSTCKIKQIHKIDHIYVLECIISLDYYKQKELKSLSIDWIQNNFNIDQNFSSSLV